MPQLAYVGLSHFRELSKKDLVAAGVPAETEGLGKLVFARADTDRSWNPKGIPNALEVPEAVSNLLMEIEPDDWKLVADGEKVKIDADAGQVGENAMNPAVGDVNVGSDATIAPRSVRSSTP